MPLRSRGFALFLSAMCTLATATLARPGEKPFDIPESEFFDRVHTVVLMPYWLPREFTRSDTLAARAAVLKPFLDTLMVARLESAGIHAIPAREAEDVRQQFADSLGGLYDPVTGAADSVRFALAWSRTLAELQTRYHPDAWLVPRVQYVMARFYGGHAHWNGVKEKMASSGGFFKAALGESDTDKSGNVSAMTLYVAIRDLQDQPLYSWGGGLQVISRLKGGKFVDVPPEELFADRERVEKAVEKALEKLLESGRKRAKDKS